MVMLVKLASSSASLYVAQEYCSYFSQDSMHDPGKMYAESLASPTFVSHEPSACIPPQFARHFDNAAHCSAFVKAIRRRIAHHRTCLRYPGSIASLASHRYAAVYNSCCPASADFADFAVSDFLSRFDFGCDSVDPQCHRPLFLGIFESCEEYLELMFYSIVQ